MKKYTYLFLLIAALMTGACGDEGTPEELNTAIEAERANRARIVEAEKEQMANGEPKEPAPEIHTGACHAPGDRAQMYAANHDFAERWLAHSGMRGLNVGALRAEAQFNNMSVPCLDCFNVYTRCSVGACMAPCMPVTGNSRGASCRNCSLNHCGAELIKCSGVLPEELPDFKH